MKIIKYLVSLAFLVAVVAGVGFMLLSKAALLELLTQRVGLGSYAEKVSALLTDSLLLKAKLAVGAGLLVLAAVTAAVWRFWPAIEGYLRTLGQESQALGRYLTTTLQGWSFGQRLVLFALFFVLTFLLFYCAYSIPFIYDELYTYIAFSSRGPLISLVFYPYPNNHVLYSVIAAVLLKGFGSIIFGMRAFSILASMLLFWVLFLGLQRICRPIVVLTALVFFFALDMVLLYSFMARGYTIILLFTAVSYCVFPELLNPNSRYRNLSWVILVGASILGMAAIPTYVFCFASIMAVLGLYWLLTRQPKLSHLLITGTVVVIGVVIFYAPLIAVSGLSALTSNKYVLPISRLEVLQKMFPAMANLAKSFFVFRGLGIFWLVLLVLGALLAGRHASAATSRWPRPLVVLSLVSLVLPLAFMVAQSVVPYERCWQYLAVPLAYLLAVALESVLAYVAAAAPVGARVVGPALLVLMVGLAVRSTLGFYHSLYENEKHSFSYRRVGALLTEQGYRLNLAQPPTYLVDSFLADANVEYDFTAQHRRSTRLRLDTTPTLLDTINGPAVIVHDKHFGIEPSRYLQARTAQMLYDDEHATVFLVNSAPVQP